MLLKVPSFSAKEVPGEDQGGVFGRLGQEDILDDKNIEFFQGRFHVAQVRVGDQGVFAHDVEGLDLAFVDGMEHIQDGEPGFFGEVFAPGLGKFLIGGFVGHGLVAREDVGQAAHVAGPLDVVLAPEGVDAAGGHPDTLPVSMARLAKDLTLSTPVVCWVIPMQ